ncbi:lytic transglycosylase domain-containing protein [Desulfococcaceae bacterium HSG8]|nr:lytic transglycosylase domain-containing protein [Desulfococcaceae bacterium HSG8]
MLCNNNAFGISQSHKLIKLGYTRHEVDQILSGQKTRKQIDYERRPGLDSRGHLKEPKDRIRYKSGHIKPVHKHRNTRKISFDKKAVSGTESGKERSSDKKINADLKNELHPNELKYFKTARSAAEKYSVDVSWLLAIIKAESGFNHKAVSPKGAVGLMQLMPDTAAYLGIEDPLEPRTNIYGGAKYFAEQVETFGRMDLALAAYNAGPGLVKRLRRVPIIRETLEYIARVFDYQEEYSMIIRKVF